ncbi:MAG: hypothetical protein QOG52_1599 [Frankiaceae bacterium]|jgi:hypothetical protein|nr:hypothetical protein [Frankiaceae bacterium]
MSLQFIRARRLAAVIVTIGSVAATFAVSKSAYAVTDTLPAGVHLTAGQTINATSSTTRLTMQSDGNLVEYVGSIPVWFTSTHASGAFAKLSTDGNLAVYNSSGSVIWSANSAHAIATYRLTIQNDGNLVVYPASGAAVWSNHRHFQAYAATLLAAHGWGSQEFSCLDNIYVRESNWQTNATNTAKSAWGIPQALPGSKMSVEGSDWQTNGETQLRWGINDYIPNPSQHPSTWTTPCGAWAFWQAYGYY